MSLLIRRLGATFDGFPRVSGDEPVRTAPINTWGGFSPRERG